MRSGARRVSALVSAAVALITVALAGASTAAAAPPSVSQVQPPSGPPAGGGLVRIAGYPLQGATSVKFGGVEAQSFTEQSGEIAAVPPAHAAGVVAVTVTTPEGTSPTYDCDPTTSPDRGYECDQFRYVEPSGGVWSRTGPMATKQSSSPTATVLRSGKVLVTVLATGPTTAAPVTEFYDPATGSFATCTTATASPSCPGPVGTARTGYTATLLKDGRVLVVGGEDPLLGSPMSSAELYDPGTGKWSPTGSLATARERHTATLLSDGRVLVVGGFDQTNQSSPTAELYNPTAGIWTPTTPLPGQGVIEHTATLLPSGKVLVAGGRSNLGPVIQVVATSSLYDPASGTWSSCPTAPAASAGCPGPLSQRRFTHTATSLADGRVLAVGGIDGDGAVKYRSVERYDPATGVWTMVDPLGEVRGEDVPATLLPNGKVLAPGGEGNPSLTTPLASAELYDDTSGRWGYTDFMAKSRGAGAAALLPPGPRAACGRNCGKVLVVGGRTADFSTPAPELFTPAPELDAISPGSGPESGGTTVEITGTGLASATAVSFGGAPAQSISPDEQTPDTKLRAVTPAHAAGAVDVTVVTEGGQARRAGAFTYVTGTAGGGPGGGGATSAGPNAGGAATPGGGSLTGPLLSSVSLSRKVFAVGANPTAVAARKRKRAAAGTTFRYTLSKPAEVAIAIAKRLSGRRKGNRCVKPSRKLRKARRCTRVSGIGTLRRASKQGRNLVAFSGRIGNRALTPGRYQATLTATDAAGNRSQAKVLSFKVVRR